jgi:hypothetical protein
LAGAPLTDLADQPFAPEWIRELEAHRLVVIHWRIDADLALGRRCDRGHRADGSAERRRDDGLRLMVRADALGWVEADVESALSEYLDALAAELDVASRPVRPVSDQATALFEDAVSLGRALVHPG